MIVIVKRRKTDISDTTKSYIKKKPNLSNYTNKKNWTCVVSFRWSTVQPLERKKNIPDCDFFQRTVFFFAVSLARSAGWAWTASVTSLLAATFSLSESIFILCRGATEH